jgi:hypothetical protein
MQILNYLLSLLFINLCNSFTLINKKNNAKFLSRDNKLIMGCDYYIDKRLYIYYHNDIGLSYINLDHNRGYYSNYFLSDEHIYEDEDYDKYIKRILEPSMKPIVIFLNNTFCELYFEKKYKKIIEYELNISNKTWNDVNQIIKKEVRYER